nr:glycosyltransferase family 39 protein [Chloroflexota bacterium]
MSITPLRENEHAAKSGCGRRFPAWIGTWEIYPIVCIAGFLRLYQINTTEFDGDQAALFRMAHDAIAYHLLPATGIVSSIRVMNPPAAVYFFLFPALLSADPLWGAILVGVVNTAAVLLTYLFTRRYYGRAAGIIAALLYATALRPVEYSRFIWQQNLLPPLVILLMFALFRGAVERRKDWFFPAALLLGLLYQLHGLTLVLAVPFLLACMFAPGTIRKRDLALTAIALAIIFFPYLLWENATHFVDLSIALSMSQQPSSVDNQAISIYQLFLSPYAHNLLNPHDLPPDDPHSILRRLVPLLSWLDTLLPWLLVGGFATTVLAFIRTQKSVVNTMGAAIAAHSGIAILRRWWQQLRADPARYGYVLLLSWQITPLLVLSRHSVSIQTHYLIMLIPGQFILIALFLAQVFGWAQHWGSKGGSRATKAFWIRYGVIVLVCLIVTAQLAGTTAELVDSSRGSFNAHTLQPVPALYFSDLSSQERAIGEADQLARQRHLHRVYIATDTSDEVAMRYLAEQMQTPNTLFSAESCLVLPALDAGPAVFLVGPDDRLANTLLGQFARITPVDRPPHLGGPPYRLYVVS